MSNESYPESFDESRYLAWHERSEPDDRPLNDKIDQLLEELKGESVIKALETVSQLLSQIAKRSSQEVSFNSSGISKGNFDILLQKQLTQVNSTNKYPFLKSKSSIINKLWRLNKEDSSECKVKLTNIKSEISDLIRSSVIAPTLHHAEDFAARMSKWKDFFDEDEISEYFSSITNVQVDAEAKPVSGYFAFHMQINVQNTPSIEIQVYSSMTSAWRQLSHRLYEETRIGNTIDNVPGSPSMRLISLGHLLHLAEVEFKRIVEDMSDGE